MSLSDPHPSTDTLPLHVRSLLLSPTVTEPDPRPLRSFLSPVLVSIGVSCFVVMDHCSIYPQTLSTRGSGSCVLFLTGTSSPSSARGLMCPTHTPGGSYNSPRPSVPHQTLRTRSSSQRDVKILTLMTPRITPVGHPLLPSFSPLTPPVTWVFPGRPTSRLRSRPLDSRNRPGSHYSRYPTCRTFRGTTPTSSLTGWVHWVVPPTALRPLVLVLVPLSDRTRPRVIDLSPRSSSLVHHPEGRH